MKLNRAPAPSRYESIIPMIDVVFFLLVFFLLIGRMDATAPFDVVPATAQTGADMPAGGATLSVARDGALALDGRAILRPQVVPTLTRQLRETPDLLIRINAHRDAELRHVLPWIAQLQQAGARDVVLVVTPARP